MPESQAGFLVLQSGEVFPGVWHGGINRAGEVVFNTSHSGYEEIATDPSYMQQIMVMTASMQGNYGCNRERWESQQYWIDGFICLDMQHSLRDSSWVRDLIKNGIPVLSGVDTRKLVLHLRERGTLWGAVVQAPTEMAAKALADQLIKSKAEGEKDWAHLVSRKARESRRGKKSNGPRVAVVDFGCKENILRSLEVRCSEIEIFPSRVSAEEILQWKPHGILLSNGPGDPADVKVTTETVRDLLGHKFIFGICMGHQILARALGAQTYKLKFGHRGANHPVRDLLFNQIYVTSQNHGYAVDARTLPDTVKITHTNLNDGTVEGIECSAKKCMSVQFHPESHPGPHDAGILFDYFIKQIT